MTLHIASGECSAEALRSEHPDYDILPFNEAMCEGDACLPVFGEEFCRLRTEALGVTMQEYMQKSPAQKLKNINSYDAAELYFDHDMFCTVNAITLLAYLEAAGFGGDICFNLLKQDGRADVLSRSRLCAAGYTRAYETVLIRRAPHKTGFAVFDRAIPLYLEYKKEDNALTRFARSFAGSETQCICAILENFREFGIGDVAARRICRETHCRK